MTFVIPILNFLVPKYGKDTFPSHLTFQFLFFKLLVSQSKFYATRKLTEVSVVEKIFDLEILRVDCNPFSRNK